MNRQSELSIRVETGSLLIVAFPERNVVLISSKWGAFSHHCTVDEFCKAADRAVAARRKEAA